MLFQLAGRGDAGFGGVVEANAAAGTVDAGVRRDERPDRAAGSLRTAGRVAFSERTLLGFAG